jgi:hypothetical protein
MARITELQEELARDQVNARRVAEAYNAKIAVLENENREKTQWAIDIETRLSAEVRQQTDELLKAVSALEETEKELAARTAWARQLDEEKLRLEEQLTLIRSSRWVKLGRKVGVGPAL